MCVLIGLDKIVLSIFVIIPMIIDYLIMQMGNTLKMAEGDINEQ